MSRSGLLLVGLEGQIRFWFPYGWYAYWPVVIWTRHILSSYHYGQERPQLPWLPLLRTEQPKVPGFPITVGYIPWHCVQNKITLPWVAFIRCFTTETRKTTQKVDALMWAFSEMHLITLLTSPFALQGEWGGAGIVAWGGLGRCKQSSLGGSTGSSEAANTNVDNKEHSELKRRFFDEERVQLSKRSWGSASQTLVLLCQEHCHHDNRSN